MLFDTAILSTSVATSSVAEAFALPEISFQVVISSLPTDQNPLALLLSTSVASRVAAPPLIAAIPTALSAPADQPQLAPGVPQLASAAVGQTVRVSPAKLSSLTGMGLLDQLALLPADELSTFTSQHADAVTKLIASQPGAKKVSAWWSGLDATARSELMTGSPSLVGNLEGVPFGLRDVANRRYLDTTIIALQTMSGEGRSELLDAQHQLHMLTQVQDALVSPPGSPERYLLTVDPDGDGTAAIVIGDLSSADYVSYLIPGMFYTVDGQMVPWTAAAQSYYDTQKAWIARLGAVDPSLADATVATVAWLGYQTPSMVNFTSLELAYKGSAAITTAVNGLRALRGADQPFLSLIAHSYGSTAAMMALSDNGITVDALAVVGSPGSSARSAAELGVAGDNVYVGEAPWDQVKDSAFFGTDPGSTAFGAHAFSVDGGTDPLTGGALLGSSGHNEYFVAGSESMRNLALVGLGRGQLITTDSGSSPAAKGVSGLH